MDSMVVDVTDVPPLLLFPGASAELIGPHQSIDDVARDADTIAYEILTRLGGRYRRLYSPSGKPRADKESVRCDSSFWVRAWWGSPRPGILRRPVMMSSSSTARRGPRSKPVSPTPARFLQAMPRPGPRRPFPGRRSAGC